MCVFHVASPETFRLGVELMGIYGTETPCCGPFGEGEATPEWAHFSNQAVKQVYHLGTVSQGVAALSRQELLCMQPALKVEKLDICTSRCSGESFPYCSAQQ